MIQRHLTDPLRHALSDTPVVLVNGARQTGKSTLVQSSELAGESRQYLTFDDPGVLAAARRDPNGFVAGLSSPVTLDEVQHVPELFPAIKVAVRAASWIIRLMALEFEIRPKSSLHDDDRIDIVPMICRVERQTHTSLGLEQRHLAAMVEKLG